MPKLLYSSETVGCGATLELDSKETCLVSVARTGVLVKGYRGRFGRLWVSIFGSTLYREKDIYKAAQTVATLDALYPQYIVPVTFKNPSLNALVNAVWHCSSAAEVAMVLNEAETADRKQSTPSGTHSSLLPVSTIEVIEAFGMLMERYPTAILDTAKLPRAKQEMKRIFMDAWRKVGDQKLRTAMEIYFTHLSQFQDGVGDTPVEFEIPVELRATAKQVLAGDPTAIEAMRKTTENNLNTNAQSYNRYFHFSEIAEKERALLSGEFEHLKRRNL